MSRTDKDMPAYLQAADAPAWMRYEEHDWCENETIESAGLYRYRSKGRAVYEKEFVKFVDVEVEYVKMIDANKVKFDAEYVKDWRRGRTNTLVYDREKHPGAEYYRYPVWYGQEWWNVRTFKKQIVATPIYRHRLVYWEWEPLRKCDIDDPKGKCHYYSHLAPACSCCGKNSRGRGKRSSKRRANARVKEMVHEYNSWGEVGDEPPPKYPSDYWW